MFSHPETFLSADKLGTVYPPHRPTFEHESPINAHHAFLTTALSPRTGLLRLTSPGLLDHADGAEIDGFLRIDDALKLYELAYFAGGDVLELGTYYALSTCIMGQAIADSNRQSRLLTIDIEHRPEAEENIRKCGLTNIDVWTLDATVALSQLVNAGRRFTFAFIDHSHCYGPVREACVQLSRVLEPGSFALFHDWNDPRNGKEVDYDVHAATLDGLPQSFTFYGVYGCTGLYRYQP